MIHEIVDRYVRLLMDDARPILSDRRLDSLAKLEALARSQLAVNRRENNQLHRIQGVDIHEKILSRLIRDYAPILNEALSGDEESLFLLDIFSASANVLFDQGFFQWSKEERNQRILHLSSFMERSLGVPEGSFGFCRGLMRFQE